MATNDYVLTQYQSDITYNTGMLGDNISALTLTLQQYPNLVLLLVFLVAFSESLIIIGLIVPGAILMVIFGAMIALNVLSFWPAVFCAIAGAVAGDTLSYWLGHKYQHSLNAVWPLSRHPELIIRANSFFNKHGTKSIILSRFIGPLRPIIPAIAGMTGMRKEIFLTANISSAIVWAPLYLLPGILFGLSIDIAREFSSKFVFIILLFIFFIVLTLWVLQRFYMLIKPYSENFIAWILNWGKKHPIAGVVPAAIFDPDHPEVRGLSMLAFTIFICALFLSAVHTTFTLPYSFDSINRLVFNSLHSFRSPPFDSLMLWMGNITSNSYIAIIAFCTGILLILKNKIAALWHLLAAIFLPLILSLFLKSTLPEILRQNFIIEFHSLPSIVLVSFIGFSTILFSSGFSRAIQRVMYYFSASFILLISLAQIYLSLQVFSQVLMGLSIGAIWISILGIAYRRHTQIIETIHHKKSYAIIIILLIYPTMETIQQKNLHKTPESFQVMGGEGWIESGWELLPVQRQDIYSKTTTTFNLQWAGNAEYIHEYLQKNGFDKSSNSFSNFAYWFVKDSEIKQLPVLPHIHKGAYETMRFYRFDNILNKLLVIRLWESPYQLSQDSDLTPLWFGDISYMVTRNNLGLKYLVTSDIIPDDLMNIFKENKMQISEKIIIDTQDNRKIKLFLLR